MKFIADCMLGKLAKWLKILGFDVVYFNRAEDGRLLDIARKEHRILLTKDYGLLEKAKGLRASFVESDYWKEQVGQVMEEFSLWKKTNPYSRCIQCNEALQNLPKRRARNLVTPYVYENARSFAICPLCGRVYWQGTHFYDMASRVERILDLNKNIKEKRKN